MTTFLQSLTSTPYALLFAGQATPWRQGLEEAAQDASLGAPLRAAAEGSDTVLSPVRRDLATLQVASLPFSFSPTDEGGTASAPARAASPQRAALSVPGIVLAQYATLHALALDGLDVRRDAPAAVEGHSQGVLGVELTRAWTSGEAGAVERVVALARLIGAAATREARRLGLHASAEATAMVSVRRLPEDVLRMVVDGQQGLSHPVSIGVRNDRRTHVLSGFPQDLALVVQGIEAVAKADRAQHQARAKGGEPLSPVVEFLPVDVPFHSDLLVGALDQVLAWSGACGLDHDWTQALARAVLVDHVDWPTQVRDALGSGARWLLDAGPGATLTRMTRLVVEGTGVGVVPAGTAEDRDRLSTPGYAPTPGSDWTSSAPHLITLPDGTTVVDTAFSRLTGRSPVLLAGMTPTTVDPEIVAAAANAGHWAELAGGGQVTEDVYNANLAGLRSRLRPGHTAEFNAMFLDRYLWNLQFGSQRIVSRSRTSGAPLDGVVISAGVPEKDEALALIESLRADGFPYVVFKPGTVEAILRVVEIARAAGDIDVIVQVEDGHSGGHHSWEDLDELLLATYATLRATPNAVVCVGGGIGTPERAAQWLSGQWSVRHGRPPMPVDGILVGTAAMTVKEARTTDEVKALLVATPGVDPDDGRGGWIASGTSRGGVTSGLSHLRADMHEVDNAAAAAARLIAEIGGDGAAVRARREEVIATLARTAKPYFGDLESMTYAQWVTRFADLSHPWVDPTWTIRFHDLLQRVEARLSPVDHGEVVTLFPEVADVEDAPRAVSRLLEALPEAATTEVTPIDAAWFPTLCRSYPKPMPFVPVLDDDLIRWWGQDGLWQAQDPRYSADSVRIIPGPVSVAGIDRVDEPVAELLARFERAGVDRLLEEGEEPTPAFARLGHGAPSTDARQWLRQVPHIMWTGHLIPNPAAILPEERVEIVEVPEGSGVDLVLHLDTAWDDDPRGGDEHAVRTLVIPLDVGGDVSRGGVPVVDEARLPASMDALLAGTAGVGSTSVAGDRIDALPEMVASDLSPFGEAHSRFTLAPTLGTDHAAVTAGALAEDLAPADWVPDALLGPAWPAIYAALGSAVHDGYPVIEGLLNAVHLDHTIEFSETPGQLLARGVDSLEVVSHVAAVEESSSGRIVTVALRLFADGEQVGTTSERFAIRGRATGDTPPVDPPLAGGAPRVVHDTPRSVLRRTTVHAPHDMTPFAIVSGDYNPIHTSLTAARVAGMDAPLVHGMWLSATAQHVVCASIAGSRHEVLRGWTYNMFGPVELDSAVEITVERVGRVEGGGLALEVTCRIDGTIVSRATASTRAPRTAYVYPGQGIQAQGMGLDERAKSPAVDDVWTRADRHTRDALGFSILSIVRDNPTEITARGRTYRHPEGVLNLTQFTQVALATLAFAQTARLREEGALVEGACFAGHSLGEYDALSAYARVFPLETVIELVFHRGSTMHSLVERDEQGRSDYRMGALRPNQFGVDDDHVVGYVEEVSRASGEFLQIVNFNLSGQQYAVAGTIAGLDALARDARARAEAAGGRNPFMFVPGIDVPFHSTVLRSGVAEFREKLEERIPHDLDPAILVDRYVPNLVARPFELTPDFVASILEVVPAEGLRPLVESPQAWSRALADPSELTRTILVELLCWQFASPVRWIETQSVLLTPGARGGLGVEEVVEVGLGASPTLANLASRTLALPPFRGRAVTVHNVQRDLARVLHTDVALVDDEDETAPARPTPPTPDPASPPTPAAPGAAGTPTPAPSTPPTAATAGGPSGADVADLPFAAADAIHALMALAARVRPEEVGAHDTTESLTNGVSSRRNQLLMDLSAELGLSSIDGAAEADVETLSATVNRLAHNYHPFGPVLAEAVKDRTRKLFGAAGAKASHISERVAGTWQLGPGWASHVTCEILLGTREGSSTREGELATLGAEAPGSTGEVDALIDRAVRAVAARRGVAVSLPSAGAGTSGAVVDSAALDAFAATVTGADGVLATTARHVLAQLGLDGPTAPEPEDSEDARVVEAVAAELGSGWADLVEPHFDARRAVLLDDRWASAREDLARLWVDGDLQGNPVFTGAGSAVADQATWWARRAEAEDRGDLASRFRGIAADAALRPGAGDPAARFASDVAVVTGMTPASIGGEVVAGLLAGGATVIATASRVDPRRLQFAKELYRRHGAPGARLWLVPANLSSYRDVDALVEWVASVQTTTVGGSPVVTKPALVPSLFFPFAAPRVMGTLADAGAPAENQMRLLLWSVERTIARLARIGEDTDVDHRLHVVLPGSPNRGTFGGDGAYAEAKSSFDAIATRWASEPVWGRRVSLAHPLIGWVRGTGLMGGNDPLVEAVEAEGVRTWSTAEMAGELLDLCSPGVRGLAARAPVHADLTGGLGGDLDLPALTRRAREEDAGRTPDEGGAPAPATVSALPSPTRTRVTHVDPREWGPVSASLEDTVVIVGLGEVGPWGSSRTRLEAELGIHSDGTVDLTPAGVLELAWMTGLLTWSDTPVGGWYDQDDQLVAEAEIFDRYRDEVVARSGVRAFTDDGPLHEGWSPEAATVFLDRDITFAVADEAEARSHLDADPKFTRVALRDGEWQVTRLSGGRARVPRRATLSRRIGGQFPTDFDPTRWGIPTSMVDSIDRIAVWNLVTAVDAFISAGFSPAELLAAVHPADVASTQGTGFGGMTSMRKLFVDRFLGEDYPQDILQETLPNVVAAHTMQSYIGGYGSMINPVGACATAAVSIDDALDKIALHKADFVVAGAIDDIQVESIEGFGSMNATAESSAMLAQGIQERFVSRANDRRRGGFVESQGGGTVLLTRASVAEGMGLPVLGVLAFAQTHADGAHTSIPAPGIGALSVGRGGADSVLARRLGALGVGVDDVAVVSKHDTSTHANDPNESDLHTRLARALGRSTGNPLFVISQKTLTGHAKGGAAVFQVSGLTQVFRTGTVPPNASLDCVDEEMEQYPGLVWLRSPLELGRTTPIRAAFATSLGFGHVSSLVAVVHPGAFEALVAAAGDSAEEGAERLAAWRATSDARLRAGTRHREAGMLGHAALFEPIQARRLPEEDPAAGVAGDPHEVEAAVLLDPAGRLGADGVYHLPTRD